MVNTKLIKIAILPGDGIGKDVVLAAMPILHELGIPLHYEIGEIGWQPWIRDANPIPDSTWQLIKNSDATLLGATTSKPEREALKELLNPQQHHNVPYVSPIIQLRQELDLFASVRPCFSVHGRKKFNLCIIRENTEGLYSGLDYDHIPKELIALLEKNPKWANKLNGHLSCTLRIQSELGLLRIFQYAFDYAIKNYYDRVTFADKPNVLRKSSAFCRNIFEEIASNYPRIQADIANVDSVAMHLVTKPERFGVIVAENMFGDILSDVAAGVMGGLGLAPSANIGEKYCYFEPVHGSGPNMAKNSANPCATFFTITMLLSHLGYHQHANDIKKSVINIINKQKILTYDLGGKATTESMANAIIEEYKKVSKDGSKH